MNEEEDDDGGFSCICVWANYEKNGSALLEDNLN